MEQQHFPGLQIDSDMRQQNREWVIQRIAWVLLAVLLLAILLGLFGRGGPLSTISEKSADGMLRLDYERFVRNHTPDKLQLAVKARSESMQVKISSEYVRKIRIEDITPTPVRSSSGQDGIVLVFDTRPSEMMEAAIHFSPEGIGKLEGWIAVDGRQPHHFNQFIYP
ncbi:MAG TPA: hypothetical protein VGU61_02265 [Noviherbaspirillum sp.]|uniref:hypothetical protein n=1 Tax=Noviherbaspirillum sp. TaxID=1926288 RepID=UPI002DDD14A5|nr:hypothetical protein [Noviherbaspirillum sp.]HEV2609066.1 hypothetical protein [Noviherbaspirillum sp.]